MLSHHPDVASSPVWAAHRHWALRNSAAASGTVLGKPVCRAAPLVCSQLCSGRRNISPLLSHFHGTAGPACAELPFHISAPPPRGQEGQPWGAAGARRAGGSHLPHPGPAPWNFINNGNTRSKPKMKQKNPSAGQGPPAKLGWNQGSSSRAGRAWNETKLAHSTH